MARGADGHEHRFITYHDGVDRCDRCGVSWADAVRGFHSNAAPPGKRKKDDGSWLASPDDGMSQGSFV